MPYAGSVRSKPHTGCIIMRVFKALEIPRSLPQFIKRPTPAAVGKNTFSGPSRATRADLLLHLVWREFAVRYRKSALGILWFIVPTLTQLMMLVFPFKKVVPLGIEAYFAFVLSGLLPWAWFGNSVTSSAPLFSSHRDLVRRANFELSRSHAAPLPAALAISKRPDYACTPKSLRCRRPETSFRVAWNETRRFIQW